jgi:hypothetical protein
MTAVTDASTTELEQSLSELALALFAPGTVAGTLQRIVDLASSAIDGCDAAGIFLVEDEKVVTAAASDPIVRELDRLQFETDEGPCLDAVSEGGSFYAVDLADEQRWRRFGPAATELGIRSVLALRLFAPDVSALNLYARLPLAFGADDRGKASVIATLAGLAMEAAQQRAAHEETETNLHEALQTREMIGQAQGILMERERITADEAFDVLRRASQHLNRKLREVATTVVETGGSPED